MAAGMAGPCPCHALGREPLLAQGPAYVAAGRKAALEREGAPAEGPGQGRGAPAMGACICKYVCMYITLYIYTIYNICIHCNTHGIYICALYTYAYTCMYKCTHVYIFICRPLPERGRASLHCHQPIPSNPAKSNQPLLHYLAISHPADCNLAILQSSPCLIASS